MSGRVWRSVEVGRSSSDVIFGTFVVFSNVMKSLNSIVNKLNQVTQPLSTPTQHQEKNIQHIKDKDSKIQNDNENDKDKIETNFSGTSNIADVGNVHNAIHGTNDTNGGNIITWIP